MDTSGAEMASEGWYPVSLSGGVDPGTSNGTRLNGEEIVVWRDAAGAPHVWEDRCPHRGMRLSFGFVRSDRIACLYHGWQYGTDGQCLYIPAHPDLKVPPTITTWRHGCHEAMGMIWAHRDPAAAPPTMPPEVAGGTVVPVRSVTVDCPAETLAERLAALDLVPFHPDLGDGAERSSRREDGLVVVAHQQGGIRETLIAGIQPLDDGRATAHLVIVGFAGEYRGAGQLHFAEFAETLRRELESGAATAPAKH